MIDKNLIIETNHENPVNPVDQYFVLIDKACL